MLRWFSFAHIHRGTGRRGLELNWDSQLQWHLRKLATRHTNLVYSITTTIIPSHYLIWTATKMRSIVHKERKNLKSENWSL